MRRTSGASRARSVRGRSDQSAAVSRPGVEHTFAAQSSLVDASTRDHDIVHDGKAAFAANPVALLVSDATVRQHSGLVGRDLPAVNPLRQRQFVGMKEVPGRQIDELVRRPTQNVDDRVGCVEGDGLIGEIWKGAE